LITVIAGVNGAGKSSVAGASIRQARGEYFNPDEVARQLQSDDASLSQYDANAKAWKTGYDQLDYAISQDINYTCETTLGGNSITQRLQEAIEKGIQVRIFYVGLSSPELHIERVKYRVSNGGHDIPEAKIRERYVSSIHNMMMLLPGCEQVVVLDNSTPMNGNQPAIKKLFTVNAGRITIVEQAMPLWAKPLAATGLKYFKHE